MSIQISQGQFVRLEIEQDLSSNEKHDFSKILREMDPKTQGEISVITKSYKVKYIVNGMAAGTILGALVGGVLTKTPQGVGIGAAAGFGAGGSLGWFFAECNAPVIIKKSDAYRQWKGRDIQRKVEERFQKRLAEASDDEQDSKETIAGVKIADLRCSISGEMFSVPMKTPCGHTFEKEAIENFFKTKASFKEVDDGKIDCPLCRRHITKEELTYDNDTVKKIKATMQRVMEAPQVQKDPEFLVGVQALNYDLIQNSARIRGGQVSSLVQQLYTDGASKKQAQSIMAEYIERHFE